ncbi:MAG: class I SAM-dependent methyltransferase [Pyrinomonadaceae bacterium]
MGKIRKPFQGVFNIVRFNWHFYALSLGVLLLLAVLYNFLNEPFRLISAVLFFGIILANFITLFVSFYVYDLSNLYKLDWLNDLPIEENARIVNINAGFDETSELLKDKFKDARLVVFDFYDSKKHTEVSIERARKAYAPYSNTRQMATDCLPLADNSADKVFAILSAHEIRNDEERKLFFAEIKRALKTDGQIIVTEHLRDTANFLAYNIGFFHFHSKRAWLKTFASAELKVKKEIKITPFITTFILEKNGVSS